MALEGRLLTVTESGFYRNGDRVGDMKDDCFNKKFDIYNIFVDPYKTRPF